MESETDTANTQLLFSCSRRDEELGLYSARSTVRR